MLLFCVACLPLMAREKDSTPYGMGLTINVPFPTPEVEQVVQDIVQDGIIRGSKEYNKDEYIMGAEAAASTKVFPQWTEGGKVFYKVRFKCLDPRNFKDGGDVGTLAVRYVVIPQGAKNTVLRIDAVYVEDFRRTMHQSNGSIETAEYKDIHDRLDSIAVVQAQTAEEQKEKQAQVSQPQQSALVDQSPASSPTTNPAENAEAAAVPAAETAVPQTGETAGGSSVSDATPQTLEEHVRDLKRQVQRVVKSPGAPLKSAPFHTASTLQSLPTGTEVLIVISTPYWLGIETHDGQHGWMLRDELDMLP